MRKLSGLIMLLLLSVVLASCTVGEEDEPDPTEAPTEPPVSARITESTPDTDVGIQGTPEFDVAEDATPAMGAADADATPPTMDAATPIDAIATPAEDMIATPEGATMPSPIASPIASPVATPQVGASLVATPAESAGMVVPPMAEPTATPVMFEMTGTIVLNGTENEAYVLTSEGCVGLGAHQDLHEGRQVVVRNENGTIVSVTTLETVSDADGCAWEFVASVPESGFYAVSGPMEFEQVFPGTMVAESEGEVTIELP